MLKFIENLKEWFRKHKGEFVEILATAAPNRYANLCVCLDNGHESTTAGKCSPWVATKTPPELYFKEWEFNREIVKRIKDKLSSIGISTYIVVPEDSYVSLTNRYKRANNHKTSHPNFSHLFISVHVNAAGNGSKWMNAKGWSAWTTKGQNNSDKLAECLYDAANEILPGLGQKIRTDMTDGDRDYEENFTVIKGANMPAVLTENLFQDNVDEVKFLLTEEGKEAITNIHVNGILKYAQQYLKM